MAGLMATCATTPTCAAAQVGPDCKREAVEESIHQFMPVVMSDRTKGNAATSCVSNARVSLTQIVS